MTSQEKEKVFVVDDDALVRKSLGRLISLTGYQVETFASANEFLKCSIPECPSCLVLDIKMPDMNGMELQRHLLAKQNAMPIPIVFISGHGSISIAVESLKKGAIDFLSKPFDDEDLFMAIEEAIEKSKKNRANWDEQARIHTCLESLTPRESEILTYVITGVLNKQIAFALNISEKTVKVHRGRVMKKMNVNSVAQLVRLTEALGIKQADMAIES